MEVISRKKKLSGEFLEKLRKGVSEKNLKRFLRGNLEEIPKKPKEKFLKDSQKHSDEILAEMTDRGSGGIVGEHTEYICKGSLEVVLKESLDKLPGIPPVNFKKKLALIG